jgi:hypothetical protein
MPDKLLDKALRTVAKHELHKFIEERGDMDFQSEVISALIRHPTVSALLPFITRLPRTIGD